VADVAVTLREITPANEAAVRALRVAPGQELLVDAVSESLEEAKSSPDAHPWFRAIYAGERPVGFVMLSYNVPLGHPDYPWRYYLWRILIVAGDQRRGYGRAAMALVIDHVRRGPARPNCSRLFSLARPCTSMGRSASNQRANGSTAKRSTDSQSVRVHRHTLAHQRACLSTTRSRNTEPAVTRGSRRPASLTCPVRGVTT
jgi:ribosomal protein S18 acetylase RimI-like enzyme